MELKLLFSWHGPDLFIHKFEERRHLRKVQITWSKIFLTKRGINAIKHVFVFKSQKYYFFITSIEFIIYGIWGNRSDQSFCNEVCIRIIGLTPQKINSPVSACLSGQK